MTGRLLVLRRAFWGSGISCIAVAALLFSLSTLAVKLLETSGGQPLPVFEVAFVPSLVCWTVTTYLMQRHGVPFIVDTASGRMLIVLRGLLGAASLALYYFAVELLELKDAVTLFFCSPVIAAVLEWTVHGNNLTISAVAGCAFTVLGVFLVTQPDCMQHRMGNPHTGGMVMATAAATCNAAAFVAVRMLRGTRASTLTITWWYHLAVLALTAIPLLAGYPHLPTQPSRTQAAMLLSIAVAQFCGQIVLNRGFQLLTATRGSAINVLQVLFSYVWQLTILKQSTNMLSIAGGICVMLGVIAVALGAGSDSYADDQGSGSAAPQGSGKLRLGLDGYSAVPWGDPGLGPSDVTGAAHSRYSTEGVVVVAKALAVPVYADAADAAHVPHVHVSLGEDAADWWQLGASRPHLRHNVNSGSGGGTAGLASVLMEAQGRNSSPASDGEGEPIRQYAVRTSLEVSAGASAGHAHTHAQ